MGRQTAGQIVQSYSNAVLYGGRALDYLGGLVGKAESDLLCSFSVVSMLTGPQSRNVGGLAGSVQNAAVCFSLGRIAAGSQSELVGGLAGVSLGDVRFCYSAVAVFVSAGTGGTGGLIGRNEGAVWMCYWDTETSGLAFSDGGTGLTSAQMKQRSSFEGWDFEPDEEDGDPADWELREGRMYPQLPWRVLAGDIVWPYGVSFLDLDVFVQHWLSESIPWLPSSPSGQNRPVDLAVFSLLSAHWLDGDLSTKISSAEEDCFSEEMLFTSGAELVPDAEANEKRLINAAETTHYLWAYSYSTKKVFRKSKTSSGNWTEVPQAGLVNALWSDGKQWLVGFDGVSFGRYSLDEGETWLPVIQMPSITPGGGIFMTNHSMAFSPTAAVLCEYDNSFEGTPSAALNGRKLYRSEDGGATWAIVKDVQDAELDDPATTAHFHTVGYHAATGTFLVSMGDMGVNNRSNRRFYKSTDDGRTWTCWLPQAGMQPMQIMDYGHPSRVLCGSDMYGGGYWLDLNTEYAFPLLYNRLTQTHNGQGYVWVIKKCNDVIYAFQYDNSASSPRWPKVWVSPDGQTWGTYYQFSLSTHQRGVRYISGSAQGYLHITMDDLRNFKLREAVVARRPCALVLPQFKNLLDTDTKSHFVQDESAWTSGGQNTSMTRAPGGLFGEYELRMKTEDRNLASYGYLMTALKQASLKLNGRNYIGHIWVKGMLGDKSGYASMIGSSGVGTPAFFWTRNPDQWIDVLTMPDTLSPQGHENEDGRISIWVGTPEFPANPNFPFVIALGGATIGTHPTHFVPGGTPRPPRQRIYPKWVGPQWTSFLAFFPEAGYLHLKDYYDRWSSSVIYDAGDMVCHYAQGQPQGKTFRSLMDDNRSEPPLNWEEVKEMAVLPRYHIKTWDGGRGDKLILYLDCCPYYSSKWTVREGRKLRLDIFMAGSLVETLEPAGLEIWDRRAQFSVVVSVGERIRMYIRHQDGRIEEVIQSRSEITEALAKGFLKNRIIAHCYGDSIYESLCFLTPYPPDKEFETAMDNSTGDISRLMDP